MKLQFNAVTLAAAARDSTGHEYSTLLTSTCVPAPRRRSPRENSCPDDARTQQLGRIKVKSISNRLFQLSVLLLVITRRILRQILELRRSGPF